MKPIRMHNTGKVMMNTVSSYYKQNEYYDCKLDNHTCSVTDPPKADKPNAATSLIDAYL